MARSSSSLAARAHHQSVIIIIVAMIGAGISIENVFSQTSLARLLAGASRLVMPPHTSQQCFDEKKIYKLVSIAE